MSGASDKPFEQLGNPNSQQAEASTANPTAGNIQVRILVELQVIAFLLSNVSLSASSEDLSQLRRDIAASIN